MKGVILEFEGRVRNNGQVNMYHYDARNHAHAAEMAKKHGQILSVRKADYDKMRGDSGKLKLDQSSNSLYGTAIGMDTIGMLGLREFEGRRQFEREKRKNRFYRNNIYRDNKDH